MTASRETKTKTVYFVRHGITEGNENNLYQTLEIPLSESGRGQAQSLAERFSRIPFDVLIASPMERAQETARAISEKTNHAIVSEDLFHEILRPSVVRGQSATLPEVAEIIKMTDSYWGIEEKKHSDEENFFDLKLRASKALDYLLNRDEETIAVVTHGTFLKMLIAVMMEGEELNPEFFESIDRFFFPENTGITWVEYNRPFRPNRWQLITWNDHAHLG